jgi:hypothetical protein
MQLVFRKLPSAEPPPPPPGEIYLRVDPARALDGQGLAGIVLEHGASALLLGPGPAERLVINVAFTHPTLDDMLAATFAQRLLEGGRLPKGCQAFADYATAIRKGLRPTDIPPEDSLEGLFLAIRNAAGKDADLTDPQVGERFRKDWQRMADRILQAAEQGINPLTESPFARRPEFMQERAFLLRDRDVYRQDVLRGERWLVRLPGGPVPSSGLFLRRPTSLFFPHWSRTDRDAAAGGAYLLLAVDWGEGVWVLSTDPAQRLPIPSLAKALQGAEAARDPEGAARDPWYDGGRPEHGHTLVAAPRAGTKLSEREVLQTVKKWAQARLVRPARPIRQLGAAAAALVAMLLLVLIYLRLLNKHETPPNTEVVVTQNGQPTPPANLEVLYNPVTGQREGVKDKNVILGKNKPNKFVIEVQPFTGDFNRNHSVGVRLILSSGNPLEVGQITVQINDQEAQLREPHFRPGSDKAEIDIDPVNGDFNYVSEDPEVKEKKTNKVTVGIQSKSDEEQKLAIIAKWPPNRIVYVLSVGVSCYENRRVKNLPNASKDAVDLNKAFEQQRKEGGDFHNIVPKTLIDRDATKKAILAELKLLETKATVYDLVVLTFSGHGGVYENRYWYFTPYDYDPENENGSGLFWTRELEVFLAKCKCNVFLLVDTCHSGAITQEVVRTSLNSRRQGLVVFAACLSGQLVPDSVGEPSLPHDVAEHSPLALAVLEALQNQYLYQKPGDEVPFRKAEGDVITLFDLQDYVVRRVEKLDGSQSVVPLIPPDFALQKIAIARNSKSKPVP